MSHVILSLSGGMDSAVMLQYALEQGHKVRCIFFNYGSKHNFYEWKAVQNLADHFDMRSRMANADLSVLFSVFKSSLLKTNPYMLRQDEIPEAHYNDPVQKATIVPGRNLIMAAILAGIAQSSHPDGCEVWLGMHTGDFAIYPDCTPTWYENLHRTIHTQSEGKVILQAPWIDQNLDKSGIVKIGLELETPFQLTRTCYKDQVKACGKCGACQERLEAFAINHTNDPIEYQQ